MQVDDDDGIVVSHDLHTITEGKSVAFANFVHKVAGTIGPRQSAAAAYAVDLVISCKNIDVKKAILVVQRFLSSILCW
jgi:hypothetical protein